MAINIDNQLKTEYEFKIAGKNRKVVFDDECAHEMELAQILVNKSMAKINDLDDDTVDKKSAKEQLKLIEGFYADVRKAIFGFFDKYFGDGSGQEIYKFNDNSTRALVSVFGKVNLYLDNVDIQQASKAKAYQKSGD